MNLTKFVFGILKCLIIIIAVTLILIPVVWIFLNSFHYFKDIVSMNVLFGDWTLHNYNLVLFSRDESILAQALNSIVYVIATLAIVIPLSIFAGYGLSRLPHASVFKWSMINFLIFSRVLPGVAIALPYFVVYQSLGLYNTLLGLVLIYILKALPLAIFMVMTFMEEIPKEIEEAAMIDGASMILLLGRVLIPLISPGLAATAVFVFIYTWNDYLFAVFLAGKEAANIQVAVAGFNAEYFIRWGEMSAATILATVPIVIFTFLVQKYLIRGLTLGAVKG